ncbi:MAG: hypothetical protein JXB45_08205 [Candidatus Krumholzibacteriota bacterium]|nr:hypothetical protein [Candidatus Krumholzibacteriota bacterium]
MKLAGRGLIFLFLMGLLGGFNGGCGEAPPCDTGLITLDETRLDAETYEQEMAETGERVADLQTRLAKKNKEIELIKDKPAEIRKKVNELKKGSGRE